MKILVTGSNGFVGGNLCRELLQQGHSVVGMGRSKQSKVAQIDYICHDLRFSLEDYVSFGPFDTIIHCAALASPWASPNDFELNNVLATRNILEFSRRHGLPHFVYISSSSVFYENRDQLQLTEKSKIPNPENQINAYSRTKLAGETLVEAYGGPFTILRPRAIFGPGDTVLLPRIVKAAEKGVLPILVRSDGKQAIGDLIFIDTLVDYIVKVCERKTLGTFNLTNNEPVVIIEFVQLVLKKLGLATPKRRLPVPLAFIVARFFEFVSRFFLNYREPPVTTFGISVFAYSKTFDVTQSIETIGQPKICLNDGVDMLVKWWKSEGRR